MSLLILFPAQSGTHHTIDGAVTVTATPAATFERGDVIAGAVTVTATPAAGLSVGRVIVGEVTVTATPAAGLVSGDVIAGDVPVAAVPSASMIFTPAGGGPPPSIGGGGLPFADPRLAKFRRRKRARPPAELPDPEPITVHLIGPDDDEFLATAVIAALVSEPW